jgi:Low-density lipoprotein receptor repeat class B
MTHHSEHLRRRSGARAALLLVATAALLLLTASLGSASAGAYIFWTNCYTCHRATIVRANQNGSGVWSGFVEAEGTTVAEGLAISGDTLYWSWKSPHYSPAFGPVVRDGIGTASVDVGGASQFGFVGDSTPPYYPTGLAAAGSYLYTGYGSSAPMWSTRMVGPAPWKEPSANAYARGVATGGGYIYWADQSTETIVRAKLNGSGGISEVKSRFITGARSPYGVAVGGGYIYWADHNSDSIGRAKLDGKEVEQDFITGAHGPEGVALDNQYVYWANNHDGTIARAKLDGGEVKQRFITGQRHPEWVAVGGPPADVSPPQISGTAQQGRQLTESHDLWLNGVTRYEYQWESCDSGGGHCNSIAGATHQSYTLSEQDVGHTLRVQESASNSDGTGEPATSAATAVVLPPAPANLSPPTISGTTIQGQTLTATHGSWSHGASSYDYEWEDCNSSGGDCAPTATSGWETYALTLADAGSTIRVKVWASNAGGTSAAAVSAPTQVVLPLPPVNSTPPSIAGDLTAGQTLTEVPGAWSNDPTRYTYRWQACDPSTGTCSVVGTEQSLLLSDADVGDTITVAESAINAGGAGGPVSSPTTAPVQALPGGNVLATAPLNSVAPVISGQIATGKTVSASTGAWLGTPSLSYTYQWLLCRSASSCTDVADATSATYRVTLFPLTDGGETLEVAVTATNAVGEATAESTDGTAVPVITPTPHPSGGGGSLPM